MRPWRALLLVVLSMAGFGVGALLAQTEPSEDAAVQADATPPPHWLREWPNTDFSRHSVPYAEIISGGPPRDGIPPIDDPRLAPADAVDDVAPTEPVIGLIINGDARAYPLRVLHWHEIVNDIVGGVPVAVTYCPLCNTSVVFDRRVDGRVLDFGTTGKLRHSDLVMYDRQTESWWQQFGGQAIVGEMTGTVLDIIPSRLESFERFKARAPADAKVLIPTDPGAREYSRNPYPGYDTSAVPFLYRGPPPEGVPAMMRVAAVGKQAWTLPLLREEGRIEAGDLVLTWTAGQASALDAPTVAGGRDVGNVVAQRRTPEGLEDVHYDVTFAFAFFAFRPDGVLYTREGSVRQTEPRERSDDGSGERPAE